MEVKATVNVEAIVNRVKDFTKELNALCEKYGFCPEIARDDETNDTFIVVNIKDFVDKKDVKISMIKEGE